MSPRVIAFDFDGVIATYAGFVHHHDIQPPNPEVVRAIKLLKEQGHSILVHTTRGDAFVARYCEQFSIPVDYINRRPDIEGENPGKPIATVYVDDRALTYRGQAANELVKQILAFKPYWLDNT